MDEYHYMDADDDMVDYLTKEVDGSFVRQEASYERTREGAEKLLNMLIAGIGGATLLLFNLLNSGNTPCWLTAGMLMTVFVWFVCAICLMMFCIRAQERPSLFADPSVLFFDDARTKAKVTLQALRRFLIYHKETSLNKLGATNFRRAKALNWIRYGAITSPAAGLLFAAIWWWRTH
jgi:Na+/melibiose symporter-like transporter